MNFSEACYGKGKYDNITTSGVVEAILSVTRPDRKDIARRMFDLICIVILRDSKNYDRIMQITDAKIRDNEIQKRCHVFVTSILVAPAIGPWLIDQVRRFYLHKDGFIDGRFLPCSLTNLQDIRSAYLKDIRNDTWYGPLMEVTIELGTPKFNGGGKEINKVISRLLGFR